MYIKLSKNQICLICSCFRSISSSGWLVEWVKRRTRATQCAIADGVGVSPKGGPSQLAPLQKT